MKRIDKEAVRAAVSGQWSYAIERICGVDTSTWHQAGPCPKCGGHDRFRAYKDFDRTGGVICRKCHDSGNSDGFSTVAWLLGCDFAIALQKVAEFAKVDGTSAPAAPKRKKPPAKPQPTRPPAVKVRMIIVDADPELRRQRVAEWCSIKTGVSLDAVLASRHTVGLYKGEPVVAFAGYLGDPSGPPASVTMYLVNGGKFPLHGGEAKNLNLEGSQDAIIVAGAPESLATATHVLKCEGQPDAFAAAGHLPPGWVAVTNACGAKAFRPEFADILSGKHVVIVHDADVPGQQGATKWFWGLKEKAASVVNVQLPYAMTEDSGKDLRDWINEGGNVAELIAAADALREDAARQQADAPPLDDDAMEVAAAAEPPEGGAPSGVNGKAKDPHHAEKVMLADLGIDVLGQTGDMGEVLIYCGAINRIERIVDASRLRKVTLAAAIQHKHVKVNDGVEPIPGTYKLQAIQTAIAVLGGVRKMRVDTLRGAGCWPSTDGRDVLLVGSQEAMRYSDGKLSKIDGCRHGRELLGIGDFDPWYNGERLAELVDGCDHAFAEATIEEAKEYFSNWCWQRDHDPLLMVGCVLATWVQTLWRFRPHIAISGRTNSGKTSFFAALASIFGELAHVSDKSTAAGIRQTVQQSARIVMLDEFEKSKHRAEILEMIRAGSRGGRISMGTSVHKPIQYTVRHSVWISAIETGLRKSPDRNRFIAFELLKPPAERQGKLPTPDPDYLGDLGQRLLAIAIRNVIDARDLATQLRRHRIAGVDDRQIECFAVPAAILAVATGHQDGADLLIEQLMGDGLHEPEFMSDELDLLHAILRCPVRVGVESVSIARLLERATDEWSPVADDYVKAMELAGVAFKRRGHKSGVPELFIDPKRMLRTLSLVERDYSDQDIRQHLVRIDGAREIRGNIDGAKVRGVAIRWDTIEKELGKD